MILHIYDLDKTLVDSDDLLIVSHQAAFAKVFGVADVAAETIEGHLGEDVSPFVRNICGEIGARCSDDMIPVYVRCWEDSYIEQARQGEYLSLMEGVPECLRDEGIVRGIATCSTERIAHEVISQTGLDDYFEFLRGAVERVTKVQLVQRVLEDAQTKHGPISKTVVIGDGTGEMEGGRAINAYCVGLTTGRKTREQLVAAGAHLVLDSLLD